MQFAGGRVHQRRRKKCPRARLGYLSSLSSSWAWSCWYWQGVAPPPSTQPLTACKKVEGQVTVEPVSGECSSPYGCGAGTIKGDIKGTISVVTTSFLTSADTPTTGVVFMTADAVFTTSSGTLLTKDAITLSSTGGEYAEVDIIVGGTGSYAGATGTLTATGGSTAQGASGTYSGQICLP